MRSDELRLKKEIDDMYGASSKNSKTFSKIIKELESLREDEKNTLYSTEKRVVRMTLSYMITRGIFILAVWGILILFSGFLVSASFLYLSSKVGM